MKCRFDIPTDIIA